MTPKELLKGVCARFTMLLHDETEKLEALLKMAIRRYQDRAGVIAYFETSKTKVEADDLPPYFLQLVSVEDSEGNYYAASMMAGDLVIQHTNTRTKPPFKISYLVDLGAIPMDAPGIPSPAIGIIEQYLYHLIEIPNNERLRLSNAAAGLPVDHIPASSEVQQRLDTLEEAMSEEGFQLPSVSFSGESSLGKRLDEKPRVNWKSLAG